MLVDNLSNIEKYPEISEEVREFIKNLSVDIQCGKYKINETDYANVETYETKSHENCFFETHEKYADIQILLSGKERLDYTTTDGLDIKTEYNEEKDIAFYYNSKPETARVALDGSNFVMLFPNEAHRPQMNFLPESHSVKKVVVKIRI